MSDFKSDRVRVYIHTLVIVMFISGTIPEVYQLHLQVAVHALFHRLYGMYPWNFMKFLRSHYRNHLKEFNEAILVRLKKANLKGILTDFIQRALS